MKLSKAYFGLKLLHRKIQNIYEMIFFLRIGNLTLTKQGKLCLMLFKYNCSTYYPVKQLRVLSIVVWVF